MTFKTASFIFAAIALTVSTTSQALVIKTLNGTTYEFLELTDTAVLGKVPITVEAALGFAGVGDTLYGFEYASRELVADLLLSYTTWDGLDGYHGDSTLFDGYKAFFSDFGATAVGSPGGATNTRSTVDSGSVTYEVDNYTAALFFYGGDTECGTVDSTCVGQVTEYRNLLDATAMVYQDGASGYDPVDPNPYTRIKTFSQPIYSNLLVRTVRSVPEPSILALMGFGLAGIGFSRRKKIAN